MVSIHNGRVAAGLALLLAGGVVAGFVRPVHAEEPAASSSVVVKLDYAMVQEFDGRTGLTRTEVYGKPAAATATPKAPKAQTASKLAGKGNSVVSASRKQVRLSTL